MCKMMERLHRLLELHVRLRLFQCLVPMDVVPSDVSNFLQYVVPKLNLLHESMGVVPNEMVPNCEKSQCG